MNTDNIKVKHPADSMSNANMTNDPNSDVQHAVSAAQVQQQAPQNETHLQTTATGAAVMGQEDPAAPKEEESKKQTADDTKKMTKKDEATDKEKSFQRWSEVSNHLEEQVHAKLNEGKKIKSVTLGRKEMAMLAGDQPNQVDVHTIGTSAGSFPVVKKDADSHFSIETE